MPRSSAARDERFAARLPRREKALLQRAADLKGLSLSAYVFEKARVAATLDLADAGDIVLAPIAQRTFAEMVLQPPKPTAALVRALRQKPRSRR